MRRIFQTVALGFATLVACGWCVAQQEGFQCSEKATNRFNAKFDLGDLTKKAVQLPRPKYPQLARTSGAYGNVKAQVVIDVNSGVVVWAQTISGHQLLQAAVRDVVCKARFVAINDVDGFVAGTLTYRFARRR